MKTRAQRKLNEEIALIEKRMAAEREAIQEREKFAEKLSPFTTYEFQPPVVTTLEAWTRYNGYLERVTGQGLPLPHIANELSEVSKLLQTGRYLDHGTPFPRMETTRAWVRGAIENLALESKQIAQDGDVLLDELRDLEIKRDTLSYSKSSVRLTWWSIVLIVAIPVLTFAGQIVYDTFKTEVDRFVRHLFRGP
jgi:hypothetical protein